MVESQSKHRSGNIVNAIALTNGLMFLLMIIAQERKWVNIISPAFLQDGFCVANKEYSVFLQSHALCFYVDTAFALILWLLYATCKNSYHEDALEPIRMSVLPTFGHGCAHMSLAVFGTPSSGTLWDRPQTTAELALRSLILIGMWYLFIRAILGTKGGQLRVIILSSAYTLIHVFFIPARFGFTYVQTMLVVTYSLYGILKEKKSEFYTATATFISLPVILVSWLEALACEAFYMHIGGHVWYDLTIPLSYCAYFLYISGTGKGRVKVD